MNNSKDTNKNKIFIIYKTTNLINGKIYIEKDKNNNPKYFGSGIYIARAIKKYGKENFSKNTIDKSDNREELDQKEIFWIKFYDAKNPNIGYNIHKGGKGGSESGENSTFYGKKHSKETKIKMSIWQKGKPKSEEAKNNMKANHANFKDNNHPMFGRKHSEKTKIKMRESKAKENRMGKMVHSMGTIYQIKPN